MDKKVILIIIGVVSALLIAFFYSGKLFGPSDFSYQISGQIKEAREGLIVIEGLVKSSKSESSRSEKKTIEFKIISETIFKKTELIPPNDVKPGEPFAPIATETQGNVSDLSVGVMIIRLQSKENLFRTDKGTATEINYAIYKLP